MAHSTEEKNVSHIVIHSCSKHSLEALGKMTGRRIFLEFLPMFRKYKYYISLKMYSMYLWLENILSLKLF